MLKELTYTQFLEWQEFDRIEPIGGLRGDWQAASICATIMNAMAMRAGVEARVSPKDMILEWKCAEDAKVKEEPKPQRTPTTPWQTMKMYARMHAAAINADEKKKQKRKKR